ncbi:MAG: 2-succinyl-5-enolpyruvyl-6-hydroxy-3-cyclohexene-1-carboxylic-acid synthase [Bacteroidetes bacterium]|nr:2-succinyl-5-enolpyruvyl-6-hydroxy-3-cyclohexene-1-carboxylic-acid synthase [Bacteroidota bacterium]
MIQGNAQRAYLIIDELVRCGVNQFIIAPGFRSAPLALAAISHPSTHVVVHFDERGSAFYALGYGRTTLRPCVWITTSGTAVANGLPAVIESSLDGVPMICLTADRPPELRDTKSNQTIDQIHIFGRYSRWFADLPAPEINDYEPYIRSTIDYAVHKSLYGPVHLNCMFREPLVEMNNEEQSIPNFSWSTQQGPHTRYATPMISTASEDAELMKSILRAHRGLIVAGRFHAHEDGQAISELVQQLDWPLFSDICAPIHSVNHSVNFFDLILRSPSFKATYCPDAILYFGFPPVSKELQTYLSNASAERFILVSPSSVRIDPFHVVTDRIQSSITEFCDLVKNNLTQHQSHTSWLDAWKRADYTVENILSSDLSKEISEPALAWLLSKLMADTAWILGANSMPIRDLQTFYNRSQNSHVRVYANRGASGIDGTLSTAAGISQADPRHGVILIGDLAMLHDINSLSLLKERNVTIIAINNNGGGIFNMLPIALKSEVFEKVLGTPHGYDFENAAKQFEIPYTKVNSCVEFQNVFSSASDLSGPCIIEVKTDRNHNANLHNTLFNRVNEAIHLIAQLPKIDSQDASSQFSTK